MTKLYFVRHGESVSNLVSQFAGSLDMPLTDKGILQAQATADYLRDIPFDAWYSSDLSRAYETGRIVAHGHGVSICATDRLREICAGDWEGKSYDLLDNKYSESYGVWRHQIGLAQCPHGESVADLQRRVKDCIDEIVRRHPNQVVGISTHATPIRVMECIWTHTSLCDMHTIPWVSNASVTSVIYGENGLGRILERDSHAHLGDLYTVLAKNV